LKNNKYWKRRLGNETPGNAGAYHQHLDFRRIDELDDTGLSYLLNGVKGVELLDLHETDITNASIQLLKTLEYVRELGLKGCNQVDNDCISDLDRINGLEKLHLKDSSITIDGLLKLSPHHTFKQVMFSAVDVDAIRDKIVDLQHRFPSTELVINSVPYGD
jgi:hypothetical protein